MPRLAFEEPKGGPLKKADDDAPEATEAAESAEAEDQKLTGRRREPDRDTVLVVLKAATVAVAIALVGLVILLATAGGEERAASPAVPDIKTSGTPSAGTTTSSPAAFVAPEVRSQTGVIAHTTTPPPAVTQPTVPTAEPPSRGQDDFVRVGAPCDTPGAYAFTESFEPVVCDRGRGNGQLVWRPIFR